MPESVDIRATVENVDCAENYGKTNKTSLLDAGSNPVVIWNQRVPNTGLDKFQKLIEDKYNKRFASYWEFHKWSIENYTSFWKEMWNYFGVICSKPYDEVLVKTGPGFLDNDWFSGARFNYAENILRHRDNRVALIYFDEQGNEETVTFAEMFEEVKLYTAAFRKNGLKKGDTVACYMSQRKEAVFAMLATTSIGAIWGGPLPYYGGRAASNIVKMMDPKFLITIDYHQDDGIPEKMLEYIPIVVENSPTVEKVIMVVSQEETYKKDLSHIRNCVFLEDFLQEGRTPDGNVPDIVFEQLPFNHPICVNFTSGTTGLPKAPVHSAGTLITQMRDFAIHLNIKSGDTVATTYPVGWSLWDYFVPSLALGARLFLYCSSVYFKHNGKNYWDMLAKYDVKLTFLVTSMVDKMEKMRMEPSPETNLDCLKIIGIGGSPVKKENFEYLQNKVKKDVFIGSMYGATEVFGTFSGFHFNMPAYGGEIQACSLGIDIKCLDEEGNSIVGQRGELAICTPAPNFPTGLWKDENNARLKETYLTKYPGVWSQNDQCWINPKTNGLIVIGRSDDTLKQNGERFGSGDIYFAIHGLEELQDYICVAQQRDNGDNRAVLFVRMRKGYKLTPEMRRKIEITVESELWEDCVPECIVEVPDIPYNLNNKRMESVIRKIVETNKIPEVMSIKNPESLKHFLNIPEVMNYYHI